MISVHLRPVADDGTVGEAIGSAFLRDGKVIYEGSAALPLQIEATLARFGWDEVAALKRLAVDGWSNGHMVIAGDDT